MKGAIFLDRDGVLNEDRDYAYKSDDVHVLPGVPEALSELKRRGYWLVVVTNQSGVARGLFTLADVEGFNHALSTAIQHQGGPAFDAVKICPHHPDGRVGAFAISCACRKPGTKLLTDAARELGIDMTRSYMIGDKDSDIACAVAAGVKGIQVNQGKTGLHPQAMAVVKSLKEALAVIPPALSFS